MLKILKLPFYLTQNLTVSLAFYLAFYMAFHLSSILTFYLYTSNLYAIIAPCILSDICPDMLSYLIFQMTSLLNLSYIPKLHHQFYLTHILALFSDIWTDVQTFYLTFSDILPLYVAFFHRVLFARRFGSRPGVSQRRGGGTATARTSSCFLWI